MKGLNSARSLSVDRRLKCQRLRWLVCDSSQGEAGQGLSESVRKYRQSVFKLNYKIKRNAARPKMAGCSPAIPATAAARVAAASAALKAEEASPPGAEPCPGITRVLGVSRDGLRLCH